MICALLGSPRKGGNTDILLQSFLQGVGSEYPMKIFYLGDLLLKGCLGCGGCNRRGECIFFDDIFKLYKELEGARALVVTSPIYFASITAQLKTFIDRAQPYWARKYLLQWERTTPIERGFFISTGAMDIEKYFVNARLVVKSFFNILDIQYYGDLFFPAIDEKGDINKREGALEAAFEAGSNFLVGCV